MRALLAILVLAFVSACSFPTAPESLNDGDIDTGEWHGPSAEDLGLCFDHGPNGPVLADCPLIGTRPRSRAPHLTLA